MLMLMFKAFSSAPIAKFSANSAKIFRVVAPQAHNGCSRVANCRAFHTKLGAQRHFLPFFNVSRCAMMTKYRTVNACIDTGLVSVVTPFHDLLVLLVSFSPQIIFFISLPHLGHLLDLSLDVQQSLQQ
jgi:hypothetical protein